MKPDPIDADDEELLWHLSNWAGWHLGRQRVGKGYDSRASGGVGSTASKTFDAMVQEADNACAAAVEAILDECTPAERCAVHHFHLSAVFRFPRMDMEEQYRNACEKVVRGLKRRGMWD